MDFKTQISTRYDPRSATVWFLICDSEIAKQTQAMQYFGHQF